MAYVAKSQKVWNDIERNIKQLFTDRAKHALAWSSYIDEQELGEMCYRALCTEEQEAAVDNIPKGWIPREKEFNFRIKTYKDKTKIDTQFYAEMKKKRPWPAHWSRYEDDAIIKKERLSPEIEAVVIKRHEQTNAVNKEKEEMVVGAKEIYNKAKSINQFVKLWEPALSLLNSETVQKLRKKTVRNASAEEQGISQEDIDKLNAGYTRAKISQ